MKDESPLAKLFQDSGTIQAAEQEKLASLLSPYVVLGENLESKSINFKPEFFKLSNIDKLEISFLAEKARATYLDDLKNEGLGQTGLIDLKIMPVGSVKSGLNKLSKEKRVIASTKGKYMIPNYRLPELFEKYSSNKGGKDGQ
ncbi:hypothetical protein C4564_02815 [Candidatus Microgenomates bacterium]|nr:MAG: hypothetical protein C4564_02815 [Candidatus Microgenomates bacterium]